MTKKQNLLILALKGIIYIYLPVILLLFIIYKVILGTDMSFSWNRIIIYVVIVGISLIANITYRLGKNYV